MDSDSDVYDEADEDLEDYMVEDEVNDTAAEDNYSLDRKYRILQPKDLITDQLAAIETIHELFQVGGAVRFAWHALPFFAVPPVD